MKCDVHPLVGQARVTRYAEFGDGTRLHLRMVLLKLGCNVRGRMQHVIEGAAVEEAAGEGE